MTERICDSCGKKKSISGGKTCEKNHFICSYCVSGGLFSSSKKICPLCGTSLR